jgi:hypothetical protein
VKNCKKQDNLKSKVFKIKSDFIVSDHLGRYIPFCDFGYHRGLIKAEEVCRQRHCHHYFKLYILQNDNHRH